MKLLFASVLCLSLAACPGGQHPSVRDVCGDTSAAASALDLIVDLIASIISPQAPIQSILSSIDTVDEKIQQGASACAHHAARERPSMRLRRLLTARGATP